MIAEALAFITQLKDQRPVTVEVDGNKYAVKTDRTLGDVVRTPPIAKPTLVLATLTGFVDAFLAGVDEFPAKTCAVQVEGFDQVALVSLHADEHGRRHVYLRAKSTEVNPFPFDSYMDQEKFLILAQAGFMPVDGNYTNMLKLCSNLTAGSSVQVADDGYSQKVVIQEGGVTRSEIELPPRIGLRPYRTFREIDPVESDFLLRFKGAKDALPTIALIAIDAGRWKVDTALAVKGWLKSNLPDGTVIIA